MESKPLHYDGSFQNVDALQREENNNEASFALTDEMRKNISGNPYMMNKTE